MFTGFCNFFQVKPNEGKETNQSLGFNDIQKKSTGFVELLSNFQGMSFSNGLYRFHKLEEIAHWNEIILDAFPEFDGRISCFGYDWLGRHFSLDSGRVENNQPQILMFEPGTGEVLEIPCDFMGFHNEEIPNYHDACLASGFFKDYLSQNPVGVERNECIGYKVPLFVGGQDIISNLEKSNMEVYWSLCSQMLHKTKALPKGAKIDKFNIS